MIDRPAQPPKGFRKPIPHAVKVQVLMRQCFRCACGEPLTVGKGLKIVCEFDHAPALTARGWDGADSIPPANDPAAIFALHVGCHGGKTVADVKTRAKTIRRQKKADAHEQAMTEKAPGQPRKLSGKIRSRGFEKARVM